ncbi:MAG: preprotein translocase subunit SecY [Candidatus Hydrothermarchaeales archaeon]
MGFLHKFEGTLTRLPEVEGPRYAITFKDKLKWTGIILFIYFLLGEIALFGLDPRAIDIFENVRAVVAGKFGSIIALGIGPIVTASIILQILVGGKLVDLDLSDPKDQALYQGTQKALAIFFTLFEAGVLVLMGALPPANNDPTLRLFLIGQLFLGGLLIIYMDEVITKWGFGSGIGLFIVAGVCAEIAIGAFNPFPAMVGELVPAGRIPALIYTMRHGMTDTYLLVPIVGTIILFMVTVYAESVRVEIPLSYGRFRGARGRYPIKFIYANVLPVIFAVILMANIQLWAKMLESLGYPLLGTFAGNTPISGIVLMVRRPFGVGDVLNDPLHAFVYTAIMVGLSMIFSVFWVETANMDSKTVAKQLQEGGMVIPGFRGDIRIIEKVLDRYIPAVTLMGGAVAGLLAAFGDLTGALGGGMGVLLTVGIVYQLYEEMAKEQMMELHPMLRGVIGDIF